MNILSQCVANTSVASSVASGNGLLAWPLASASAYGSRHHELTLICRVRMPISTDAHLADTSTDNLLEERIGKLVGAVSTDRDTAFELLGKGLEAAVSSV